MRRILDLPLFVILMGISALAMYVPAAHALTLRDHATARPFFYSGTLFLFLVALLGLATAANRPGNIARNHLLAMVAAFTVLPLMLAIPFNEAVPDTGLFNAWWEMVSSFTTTGASLYEPARLAPSLHLWRATVGWMGGFFMLVMAIAVLAPMRIGGFEVFFAAGPSGRMTDASPGPVERVADPGDRVLRYAMALFPTYLGLTLVLWVALLISGDPTLVALCHAMSTLATSGISPITGPATAPSGMMGEVLIFLFLIPALSRRFWPGARELRVTNRIWDDPELKLAASLVLIVPLILFLRHWIASLEVAIEPSPAMMATSLWGGFFTVLSFLTTTGFESSGWLEARNWSGLGTPGLILAGLAITGGGVATTAGGVRLLRVYALLRHGERELERLVHPASIGGGGVVARRLRREGAYMSWIFFMLFAMSIAVVMMAVSMAGLEFEPATILSIAALSNTGPLASIAGDAPINWATLTDSTKAILVSAMVLGRLETLAIIALFNPEFWRN
ncbi:TrkH family potassium uptake protein [Phaeovulum sp.]|uniref:TrkH family potassium uptake protein n=1 Tax=Phaeovulum sp. TaxID=2934796 RepID=UPI0039E432E7